MLQPRPHVGFVPRVVIDSNTITCEVREGATDEIDRAAVFVLDEVGVLASSASERRASWATSATIDVVGLTRRPLASRSW